MKYEWFRAGNKLHLMPNDSYTNTLCGQHVSGRSARSYNEDSEIQLKCKNCVKQKDKVV